MVRGIRGAISVGTNSKESILQATHELLNMMVQVNQVDIEQVACIFFTTTDDLDAVYPAQAAREMGWTFTALMCVKEIPVPGSLPLCIRVLILWNTDLQAEKIKHVYLGEAKRLRPDLMAKNDSVFDVVIVN